MNNLNLSLPKINIPGLFKSRRFWVAVITAIVDVAIMTWPEVEGHRAQLIEASTIIAMFLVGGYSLEDAIRMWQVGAEKEKYQ
jgi:hypothetical protein